ncbi:MAG: hypothetical protein WDA25_08900 [Paracoccaceae bacterium]
MGDASQLRFNERLLRITQRHKALENGYTASVNHDGLIVARPRKRRIGFPFRGLSLALVLFIAFKGFVLADLGQTAYGEQITRLAGGNLPERAGAWVMQADGATQWVATTLAKVFSPGP